MTDKPTILYQGLAFPESPRWRDDKLWFSDMHARKVMTIDTKGKVTTVCEIPDRTSGLGWTLDGRLLIVGMKEKKLWRLDTSGPVCIADISALASGECNDMVVDASGRAYIGNFGLNTDLGVNRVGPGEIVIVEKDGRTRVAAGNITFPNGSVITPDGRTFIVAETFASKLTAFDIQPDGSLTNRRVWAPLAKGIFADGICLDAAGAVWVANAGGPAVYRVKEGGEVLDQVETSAHAYACMLGGADRRTLFIMAAEDTDARICRQKMSGRIETVKVAVPGAGRP
jgi:sugar lactone lactonase YvrE